MKKQEIEIIDTKQTKITDWYDKLLDDLKKKVIGLGV